MDQNPMKTQYVQGRDSYRTIAEQYGLSLSQVSRMAKEQDWVAERRRFRQDQTVTEPSFTQEEREEETPSFDRLQRLLCLSDRLLDVVEQAVNRLRVEEILSEKTAIKTLAGAIKDIKSIQSVSTELDFEEQRARIAKLNRQGKEEIDTTEIRVTLLGAEGLDA